MSDWSGDDWDDTVLTKTTRPDDIPSDTIPQKYLTDSQAWTLPFPLSFPTLTQHHLWKVDMDEHLMPTKSTPVVGRVIVHYADPGRH